MSKFQFLIPPSAPRAQCIATKYPCIREYLTYLHFEGYVKYFSLQKTISFYIVLKMVWVNNRKDWEQFKTGGWKVRLFLLIFYLHVLQQNNNSSKCYLAFFGSMVFTMVLKYFWSCIPKVLFHFNDFVVKFHPFPPILSFYRDKRAAGYRHTPR